MDVKLFPMFLLLAMTFCDRELAEGARSISDDIEQLIQTAGFKSEVYHAETEDGYILKVHRIQVNKTSDAPRLGPVFFMHGLTATAADFLMTGPYKAFPYLLSNNGYDVWLGNSRGSNFGLRHKTLKPSDDEFWNFSFHEIGFYDVPAMFDLMLKKTGSTKAFYVAHSQGASSILVLLSTRPEYNQKFIQTHLMAPAALMKNFPRSEISFLPDDFEIGLRGRLEMSGPRMKEFSKVCNQAAASLCEGFMTLACGKNKGEQQLDPALLPTIINHLAYSISLKQAAHYFQLIKSGTFRFFDYRDNNTAIYNSPTPPLYNLKNFKAPAYVYSGGCDALTSAADAQALSKVLPNVRKYQKFDNFNHCDFNYGKNSRKIVFEDILKSFNSEK